MSSLFKNYLEKKYNIHYSVKNTFNSKNDVFINYNSACEHSISLNLIHITNNYVLTQSTTNALQSRKNSNIYKLNVLLEEMKDLKIPTIFSVKKFVLPFIHLKPSLKISLKTTLAKYLSYVDFIVNTHSLCEYDNGEFPLYKSRLVFLNKLFV